MTALDGEIRDGCHHMQIRVYYEDTDFSGIVYHANYLRFMERARSDMLRALGIDQRAALESGEGVYAVAEVNIRYRAPARLGDALLIVTDIEAVRAASVLIQQRVRRGEDILAEAAVIAAFITPEGRPRRQPRDWVRRFERLREEPGA
ncbi:MAG: tol-pal system-associated acyl-CoA thioesterase [Allosphingosinicella sp.]